jgi:hypothetical protein
VQKGIGYSKEEIVSFIKIDAAMLSGESPDNLKVTFSIWGHYMSATVK